MRTQPSSGSTVSRIGALATGAVVAYITWFFLTRLDEYSPAGLATVLSLLAGGAVVGLLARFVNDREVWGFYPIGLLVGFLLYLVLFAAGRGELLTSPPPTR
jgi:hypothetical protein